MAGITSQETASQRRYLLTLSVAALGIVYGDIGTSPLYALRECFSGTHPVQVTQANVFGVLSLIFWSLIIIISIKYQIFILKADNRGEGGILALTALVVPPRGAATRGKRRLLLLLGLFGAALLYGDGMITPAISVLSAVEGLEIATPFLKPYIIPITIVILIGLFLFQRRGTSGVGAVFGPVTLVWFLTLALMGIYHIVREPKVLIAVNPLYAVEFFLNNGWRGFLVLGAVFLVVTGGEALYADMGHFGIRPIRLTWFSVVLPAILSNYFGQGALLIGNPSAARNPFYHMAPQCLLYPLVILSTAATVIASQAVISGAFSLTMQAMQLGYSPRLDIEHTSASEKGQIYMPTVNWILMAACISLVLGFQSSSHLAAAYGVAITATMVITTILFYFVARNRWNWPLIAAGGLAISFLTIDLSFFSANFGKIANGGWFPLIVAALVFTLMSTWKSGREILAQKIRKNIYPFSAFLEKITLEQPLRVPGTAVYMSGNSWGTPPALLQNLKHNKVLHELVVVLTVETEERPRIPDKKRVEVKQIGAGLYQVIVRYGFMEGPNIPKVLKAIDVPGLDFNPRETTFFLGRETLIATDKPRMPLWRQKLFVWMSRSAMDATAFFNLPPKQVIELGVQVEL